MYIKPIPTQKHSNRHRNYSLQSLAVPLLVLLLAITTVTFIRPLPAVAESFTFNLTANPKFFSCLARFPNNPHKPPVVTVTVTRGNLNDTLVLKAKNIKPNLSFDLFTVQHSSLLADGTPDPNFKNFGLAWYQSDIEISSGGTANVKIQTVLLDQIFGFDPDAGLAPTNTFHVGFWFSNPDDAAPCGFTGTTPFNGTHNAGPLAMISLPDPATNLGPLCTNPDTSTDPPTCNP
ncbi:MAG TPA: hypothetical protein VEM15_08650 [Thermodesulfobacteriota bacterium]|nr:hypothetical protein [Thermodesulfobacteriota bacterium]